MMIKQTLWLKTTKENVFECGIKISMNHPNGKWNPKVRLFHKNSQELAHNAFQFEDFQQQFSIIYDFLLRLTPTCRCTFAPTKKCVFFRCCFLIRTLFKTHFYNKHDFGIDLNHFGWTECNWNCFCHCMRVFNMKYTSLMQQSNAFTCSSTLEMIIDARNVPNLKTFHRINKKNKSYYSFEITDLEKKINV